jgi:hypothetical protein
MYGPLVLALEKGANPGVSFLQRTSVGRYPKLNVAEGRFAVRGEALQRDGSVASANFILVPFAEAKEYRIWLNRGPIRRKLPVSLGFGARELLSSRDEEYHGVLTDESTHWERRTRAGSGRAEQEFDFYGVEFDEPVSIRTVRFHQGTVTEKGGWFAGQPEVQVQREKGGAWETVMPLAGYPASRGQVKAGAIYEAALPEPQAVKAVRVRGKRGGEFTACSELEVLP